LIYIELRTIDAFQKTIQNSMLKYIAIQRCTYGTNWKRSQDKL